MSKKVSKRFRSAQEIADLTKHYSLEKAMSLLGKMPQAKFDETVELSVFLGVDPKQSDQMVRGTVSLPHGSGKEVKVIAFTETPDVAIKAGAEVAGLEDLIEKIEQGWLDFDVAVATPSAMKEVRKIARVLGPRGLMPNPKLNTVAEDLEQAIKAVKAGRVEFKMDKGANVAVIIGKRTFSEQQLVENANAALNAIHTARPDAAKGHFVQRVVLSSSMSPGVKLNLKEITSTIAA